MGDIFTNEELKHFYPSAIVVNNGKEEIDYKKLCMILAQELNDIQDQLNEKDYQILKITERLDLLES